VNDTADRPMRRIATDSVEAKRDILKGVSARRSPAMPLYAIGEHEPVIDPTAFVHPEAVVIGNVTIGPESTVWPSAVLRGDRTAPSFTAPLTWTRSSATGARSATASTSRGARSRTNA
jgi:hypothetical protein